MLNTTRILSYCQPAIAERQSMDKARAAAQHDAYGPTIIAAADKAIRARIGTPLADLSAIGQTA